MFLSLLKVPSYLPPTGMNYTYFFLHNVVFNVLAFHKWKQTISIILCLASFTWHMVFEINLYWFAYHQEVFTKWIYHNYFCSFSCGWVFWLFQFRGYYEWCCSEHSHTMLLHGPFIYLIFIISFIFILSLSWENNLDYSVDIYIKFDNKLPNTITKCTLYHCRVPLAVHVRSSGSTASPTLGIIASHFNFNLSSGYACYVKVGEGVEIDLKYKLY